VVPVPHHHWPLSLSLSLSIKKGAIFLTPNKQIGFKNTGPPAGCSGGRENLFIFSNQKVTLLNDFIFGAIRGYQPNSPYRTEILARVYTITFFRNIFFYFPAGCAHA
jgi:hypothetical protein